MKTKMEETEIEEDRLYFYLDFREFVEKHNIKIAGQALPKNRRQPWELGAKTPVNIQQILGKEKPPTPYEHGIYWYSLKPGDLDKLRKKRHRFIIVRWTTRLQRSGIPIPILEDGRPVYPYKRGEIDPSLLLGDKHPYGAYLTCIKEGETTTEKERGKTRIYYPEKDSILSAFTSFYETIPVPSELVFVETGRSRKLYNDALSDYKKKRGKILGKHPD